jgi:hypothetical protein
MHRMALLVRWPRAMEHRWSLAYGPTSALSLSTPARCFWKVELDDLPLAPMHLE